MWDIISQQKILCCRLFDEYHHMREQFVECMLPVVSRDCLSRYSDSYNITCQLVIKIIPVQVQLWICVSCFRRNNILARKGVSRYY